MSSLNFLTRIPGDASFSEDKVNYQVIQIYQIDIENVSRCLCCYWWACHRRFQITKRITEYIKNIILSNFGRARRIWN